MIHFLFDFNQTDRTRPRPRTRPSQLGSVGRPPGAVARPPPPHARRRLPTASAAPAAAPPPHLRFLSRFRPPTRRYAPPDLADIIYAVATARRAPPFAASPAQPRAPPPAAAHSISAVTAPQTTPRRLDHLLDQVNLPDPFSSAADAPPPPPSSASFPCLRRARRRAPGDGSPSGGCRRVRLTETQLADPSRTAAVAGSAGDAVAGGGGRV